MNITLRSLIVILGIAANQLSLANEISVLNLANLSFGKIAVGSGGSVTVSPAGARSKSGGVVLVSGGSEASAMFRLNGTAGQAYIVSLPGNNEAVLSSGGQTMKVVDFTLSPSSVGSLSLAGDQTLYLGGTLLIDSVKPPGDYSGSFSLIVDYQ